MAFFPVFSLHNFSAQTVSHVLEKQNNLDHSLVAFLVCTIVYHLHFESKSLDTTSYNTKEV